LVARLEESFLGKGLLDRLERILAEYDKRIQQLDDLIALASMREDDLMTAIRRSEHGV
jgi:hypothetical protein